MSAVNERNIGLTARLYDARRVLRDLFGDRYPEHIRPWCEIVRAVADGKHGGDVLPAALALAREAETGEGRVNLLAAAVELIEQTGDAR